MEFKVFKSFEFLSQSASMEGVQTGVLDILQTDKAPWSVYTDAFKFADLGYSLPDWDTSLRFMKSDLFKKRAAIMEQQVPVKVLPPFGGGGFRMLYNRVRQLKVPADTKGLKYRTTGSAQEIAVVRSWGASPTPMPWNETYTALQQGVIDGVHVPPVFAFSSNIFEVAKHATEVRALFGMQLPTLNIATWNAMPEDIQKPFILAAQEAADLATEADRARETEFKQRLTDAGMAIYDPNPSETKEWLEKGEGTWAQFDFDKSLLDELRALRG